MNEKCFYCNSENLVRVYYCKIETPAVFKTLTKEVIRKKETLITNNDSGDLIICGDCKKVDQIL